MQYAIWQNCVFGDKILGYFYKVKSTKVKGQQLIQGINSESDSSTLKNQRAKIVHLFKGYPKSCEPEPDFPMVYRSEIKVIGPLEDSINFREVKLSQL